MQKYAIEFNNRTITLVEGSIERNVFLFISSALAASFALYLVFVGATIVNIVERKNIESGNRTLSSRVSELELAYLSESNKVDLNLAYSLGFKDATNAVFASNTKTEKSLSFAGSN
ncbi:MAG: hypothetical protein WC835_01105 [Candidatus Paceibacterota bacterium]|jgi:hypothetical protein